MKKIWIALAAAVLMCLMATGAAAEISFTYTVNEDGETATITGFTGEESGDLVIPGEIDGYTITAIGFKAFSDCSGFTGSLTIPDGISSIGEWAFYGCSGFTGSLTIPNSVSYIGDYAFDYCTGFTGSLTIPDSVASIGNFAFRDCSGITEFHVNDANNYYTSLDGILYTEDMLCLVAAPCGMQVEDFQIPDSITSIGVGAFYNCSGFTGSLIIPNNVSSIENYAFLGCTGFTGALVIPDSVSYIGTSAFLTCSGFSGSLSIPDNVTSIGNYAFEDCSGFTGSLSIPKNITSIGDSAFRGCSGFTGNLSLPASLTSIGDYVFYNCSGFTGSLSIPKNVTSIGNYAFRGCSGFTGNLSLPASLTSVGSYAFGNCSVVNAAYFYGDVPATWGTKVFNNSTADFTIYYPAGNTSGWTSSTWTAPDGTVYNTATFTPEDTTVTLPGDLSGDGVLDSTDVLALTRYFAGYGTTPSLAAADIDGNGKITRRDAMILARTVAGWDGYRLPWSDTK